MAPILENFYRSTGTLDVEDNNFPCDCRLDWFMSLMNRTESASLKLTLENFKCFPEAGLHDKWMKRVESDKINNPVNAENEETAAQGADYEYYDDTELNGKLFYTDVRDLLNCTKMDTKPVVLTTTVKPQEQGDDVTKGLNTKVTANPIFSSTLFTRGHEKDVLDTVTLKTTRAPEAIKSNVNEVANQMNKETKPNIYTTSRLATVSAKPLERKHYEDGMASDEAKPDRIKAHRSIQDINDDLNDSFNNATCFLPYYDKCRK
ncbi:unnamed protein product, partial [Iphiclides podalirius]